MPYWNETLPIHAPFQAVAAPNTLLLFELVDDRPSLKPGKQGGSSTGGPRPCKRIAWGYLLPVGTRGQLNVGVKGSWRGVDRGQAAGGARVKINQEEGQSSRRRRGEDGAGNANEASNLSSAEDGSQSQKQQNRHDLAVRIQMFSYANADGPLGAAQRAMMGWPPLDPGKLAAEMAYPDNVPSVYVQWRRQHHRPVEGAMLEVSLGPRPNTAVAQPVLTAGVVEGGGSSSGNPSGIGGGGGSRNSIRDKAEMSKAKAATIKRTRGPREACVVPDRLVHRLEVGPEGAMVVAFSKSGHLLAVAAKCQQLSLPFSAASISSPYPGNTHCLRLFDTDTGMEVWSDLSAHYGVVYDIKWSADDSYILTASSDGTCKVYDTWGLTSASLARDRSPTSADGGQGDNADLGPGSTASPSKRTSGASQGGAGMQGAANAAALAAGGGSPWALLDRAAMPRCVHVLQAVPPTYVYTAIFQEYGLAGAGLGLLGGAGISSLGLMSGLEGGISSGGGADYNGVVERQPLARIITGSGDGRIRVYQGPRLLGMVVPKGGYEGNHADVGENSLAHLDSEGGACRVQALAIDERSRYLISGASNHDIYVWKKDEKGWYQLQRTFKHDASLRAVLAPVDILGGGNSSNMNLSPAQLLAMRPGAGVTSLCMHPEKTKSQLLALSHTGPQTILRVMSTSTYKQVAQCVGAGGGVGGAAAASGADANSGPVFCRAVLSSDGRLVASGVCAEGSGPTSGRFHLGVWDSSTGQAVSTPLSDVVLPYPVRAMSWHPRQHVVAVAMVGPGACVAVFGGERGKFAAWLPVDLGVEIDEEEQIKIRDFSFAGSFLLIHPLT